MYRLMKKLRGTKWNIKCKRSLITRSHQENISVPDAADVVIIGGGSAGCNALYNLAKRGVKAVLLDKSKLISGTTWHTAGLVWSLRGSHDVDMELLQSTRRVYSVLEEETGTNAGWVVNGGLYIARSPERVNDYKRLMTMCKTYGIEANLISPSDAKKIFPLLDDTAFKGAVYSPNDGVIDPAMLINALTKSAKSHGCKIIENCPVTKIHTKKMDNDRKQISGVETPYGIIKTNLILNAAGAWSRNLSQMIGLDIPLIPMKHAYVVTEPIEESRDLPNIRDPDADLYFKVQGGAISIGGYESNPIILESAPVDFSFSLYELDWNVFNTHMEQMIKILPILSTRGIRTTVCGPESFTPDHKPLMGEDPRCAGLYYSCGYNSAGMMLGGGCGEQIALWIINGRPEKYMFDFDIRRFSPEQKSNHNWIKERSHEAYAKNYNIIFPHDEALSGRNLRTDPFHDLLLQEGAVMEERQGWERPGWFMPGKTIPILPYDYGGYYDTPKNENYEYPTILEKECNFDFPPHHNTIGDEANSCRKNVALFNMSYFGKFYLCGPEAQSAADYIFTANTNRDSNRIVYTCMLNRNGGVEADCTATVIEPGSGGVIDPIFKDKGFYIVSSGLSAYHTWAHMNKIINEKDFNVSLHNVTDQIGILSIQGRNSWQILEELVEDDISNESLLFSTSKLVRMKNQLVRIFRLSFVGELGFELHIPNHSCQKIYKAIMNIGKKYEMKLAGFRALYSLSCEKGYHLWGSDLRTDDNPVEAGLGFLCRNSGEYLGKEAVDRIKETGVKRKLVHLHIKNDVPLWGLETIYRNDQLVGYLRRAEYGYTFGNSLGHGYIKHPNGHNITKEFLKSGNYKIEVMGKRYPADFFTHSPFDPQNKRMLGIYEY